MPWMWTLAFGHREDCTPTHGYEETRGTHLQSYAERLGLDPVLFAGALSPLGVSDQRRQAWRLDLQDDGPVTLPVGRQRDRAGP
jgi:hypothetical protein